MKLAPLDTFSRLDTSFWPTGLDPGSLHLSVEQRNNIFDFIDPHSRRPQLFQFYCSASPCWLTSRPMASSSCLTRSGTTALTALRMIKVRMPDHKAVTTTP